jgi:hypothetical protein
VTRLTLPAEEEKAPHEAGPSRWICTAEAQRYGQAYR